MERARGRAGLLCGCQRSYAHEVLTTWLPKHDLSKNNTHAYTNVDQENS